MKVRRNMRIMWIRNVPKIEGVKNIIGNIKYNLSRNKTNPHKPLWNVGVHGATDGTRTRDLLITNELLYQLSYSSILFIIAIF